MVTVVLNCPVLEMTGKFGPVTSVHNPVPGVGSLPLSVMKDALQRFCDGPAFAVTRLLDKLTITSAEVAEHEPLLIVHRRI